MKGIHCYLFFCLVFLLSTPQLNATQSSGGQITYRLIDSNTGTYKFFVDLYMGCSHTIFQYPTLKIYTPSGIKTKPCTLVGDKVEISPIAMPPTVVVPKRTQCNNQPWDILDTIRFHLKQRMP